MRIPPRLLPKRNIRLLPKFNMTRTWMGWIKDEMAQVTAERRVSDPQDSVPMRQEVLVYLRREAPVRMGRGSFGRIREKTGQLSTVLTELLVGEQNWLNGPVDMGSWEGPPP